MITCPLGFRAFVASLDLDVVDLSRRISGDCVATYGTVPHAVDVVLSMRRDDVQIGLSRELAHDVLGNVGTVLKDGGDKGVVCKGKLGAFFTVSVALCNGDFPLSKGRCCACRMILFVLYHTLV